MSHAAVYAIIHTEPRPVARHPRARANVLLASLAGAFVTTCLSAAAIDYALTHVPEVDPNAEAAPIAAVAAITADAPAIPAKLKVLTPPVYGPGVINEAPAGSFAPASFVPLKAQTRMEAADMNVLAQAGGDARPCPDPCAAEAGYIAPDGRVEAPPPAVADDTYTVDESGRDAPPRADNGPYSGDDDGNAPPPPDMIVN